MEKFGVHGLPRAELSVECKRGSHTEVHICASGLRSSLQLGENIHSQLHWATLTDSGAWQAPAQQPSGSVAFDQVASRMPMNGGTSCQLQFPRDAAPSKIVFVLLVEGNGQQHWLKAAGDKDFVVDVSSLAAAAMPVASAMAPAELAESGFRVTERPKEWPALEAAKAAATAGLATAANGGAAGKKVAKKARGAGGAAKAPVVMEGVINVEGSLGSLSWQAIHGAAKVEVFVEASLLLRSDASLFLHWGCIENVGGEWQEPALQPEGAVPVGDGKATRSLIQDQARLVLSFPKDSAPAGLAFVLYAAWGGGEQWLKSDTGSDFCVQVGGLGETSGKHRYKRGMTTSR